MKSSATLRRIVLAILPVLLVPAACGDDPTALIDALTISNETDRYTFELDNPGTYSGTTRHQWTHTGTIAQLIIESPATAGIGTIAIQDADNGQVLSHSVLVSGTFDTQAGRAGTWIVTTILTNVTGQLKYRIVKK